MKGKPAATICFVLALTAAPVFIRAATGSSDAAPTPAQAGEQVFKDQCAVCHSTKPDETLVGPSLYGEISGPHPKKTSDEVREIVLKGKERMPGFEDVLKTKDIDNLLEYMRTLSPPDGKS